MQGSKLNLPRPKFLSVEWQNLRCFLQMGPYGAKTIPEVEIDEHAFNQLTVKSELVALCRALTFAFGHDRDHRDGWSVGEHVRVVRQSILDSFIAVEHDDELAPNKKAVHVPVRVRELRENCDGVLQTLGATGPGPERNLDEARDEKTTEVAKNRPRFRTRGDISKVPPSQVKLDQSTHEQRGYERRAVSLREHGAAEMRQWKHRVGLETCERLAHRLWDESGLKPSEKYNPRVSCVYNNMMLRPLASYWLSDL